MSKIYTKTGDKGSTSLFDGSRVQKSDARIEAYGTIDELNSHLGMLIDLAKEHIDTSILETTQHHLFNIGSYLATPSSAEFYDLLPKLTEAPTLELEQLIDEYTNTLVPLKYFILPGGHPAISQAHICRTITRRSERRINELEQTVDYLLINKYINRLSDFFFVFARVLAKNLNIPEKRWIKAE